MTKLTTESLEKFVNDIKTDGMCDITDHQVELALIRLLAYEQAAKNPVAWVATDSEGFPEYNGHNEFSSSCGAGTPLYAAPVLPKQPEHSRQHFESLCNQFWNWAELDEIDQDEEPRLEWNGSNYTHRVTAALWKMYQAAPAQPVIPEQPEPTISFYRDGIIAAAKWVENQRDAYDNEHGQSDPDTGAFEFGNDAQLEYSTTLSEIAEGIRSLHPASAQPVSEPYKLAKSPEACTWISDGEGLWLGDCGLTWTFFDDGPNENGLKYCPSCGKKVSFIAAPAQESENG